MHAGEAGCDRLLRRHAPGIKRSSPWPCAPSPLAAGVLWAQPEVIYTPAITPNDPSFASGPWEGGQWALRVRRPAGRLLLPAGPSAQPAPPSRLPCSSLPALPCPALGLHARCASLQKMAMTAAWDMSTGGGAVGVCVIDSGINLQHPDLAPNIAGGWNL